jgi:hypothetical protein
MRGAICADCDKRLEVRKIARRSDGLRERAASGIVHGCPDADGGVASEGEGHAFRQDLATALVAFADAENSTIYYGDSIKIVCKVPI